MLFCNGLHYLPEVAFARLSKRFDSALVQGKIFVGYHQFRGKIFYFPETVAQKACSVRRIEAEIIRSERIKRDRAVCICIFCTVELFLLLTLKRSANNSRLVFRHTDSERYRLFQPLPYIFLDDKPVHDKFDGVALVPLKLHAFFQFTKLAVDTNPEESFF